jgi:hypothetical protein
MRKVGEISNFIAKLAKFEFSTHRVSTPKTSNATLKDGSFDDILFLRL